MDAANKILQASFRTIIANADRDGFERPFQITVTDGAGVALLTEGDTAPHEFPFTFTLTDKNDRTAELIVEAPEPHRPRYVQ